MHVRWYAMHVRYPRNVRYQVPWGAFVHVAFSIYLEFLSYPDLILGAIRTPIVIFYYLNWTYRGGGGGIFAGRPLRIAPWAKWTLMLRLSRLSSLCWGVLILLVALFDVDEQVPLLPFFLSLLRIDQFSYGRVRDIHRWIREFLLFERPAWC